MERSGSILKGEGRKRAKEGNGSTLLWDWHEVTPRIILVFLRINIWSLSTQPWASFPPWCVLALQFCLLFVSPWLLKLAFSLPFNSVCRHHNLLKSNAVACSCAWPECRPWWRSPRVRLWNVNKPNPENFFTSFPCITSLVYIHSYKEVVERWGSSRFISLTGADLVQNWLTCNCHSRVIKLI